MADVGVNTHHVQHPPPANAEHDLLFQAQLAVTTIELSGDAPVCRRVRRVVRIHQVQSRTSDLYLPYPNPHRGPWEGNGEPYPFAVTVAHGTDWELARIVERIERLLPTSRVDHLTEISALIEQADPDDRNPQVFRRFQEIAGNVPEPA